MNRKTKTSQKASTIVPKAIETSSDQPSNANVETEKTDENDKQNITLEAIYNKLSGLDRIENKLYTLGNRVEHLEQRVAQIEDNLDSQTEENPSATAFQETADDLQKRLETLENRDRQANIKVLNLPIIGTNQVESNEQLKSKILNILKHVNPNLTAQNILELRRLHGRRNVGQTAEPTTNATNQQMSPLVDEFNQKRAAPVLVRLSSTNIALEILKIGNKRMKTYETANIKLVDDVSKSTQAKRATLIPKMKQLRASGLFAFIPFGPVAKITYKEGADWKNIFPEN